MIEIPDISVICTVKNGEKTIVETIKSVTNQTFKNWEFIIIDDGSTDSSKKIIKKYTELDKRIKLIETTGLGRGRALNLAIKKTKGKYIANIDADDTMHPEKLEIQYKIIKGNTDLFLICSLHSILYNNQQLVWNEIDKLNIKVEHVEDKNLKKNQVVHSSVLMDKNILIDIGKYDEKRISQFDYELWLRAANKGYRIGRINNRLVGKRIHSNQSFEQERLGQLTRSLLLQLKYIIKGKKIHLIIYPMGRAILGILPFKLRRKIRNIIRI